MGKIDTRLDSGLVTFTFTDNDDHVFSAFRINPADLGMAERTEEVDTFFKTFDKSFNSVGEMAAKEKEIEEKISYLLGYDSGKEIFGEVGALSLLPDGTLFMEHVLENISSNIEKILKPRADKMQKRVAKYTKKYKDAQKADAAEAQDGGE